MSDPEFDPDFVEAFNNAADDELEAQDSERQPPTPVGGCFAVVLLVITAVIAFLP